MKITVEYTFTDEQDTSAVVKYGDASTAIEAYSPQRLMDKVDNFILGILMDKEIV